MTNQEEKQLNPEMLQELGNEIIEGLTQMLEFEQKLNQFSKRSLILFIVLAIDIEKYKNILSVLEQLEPLTEENKKVGY